MSEKYIEYEEVLKCETYIHEMFITICQKTDIENSLKNVLDKCGEIRQILYNIVNWMYIFFNQISQSNI